MRSALFKTASLQLQLCTTSRSSGVLKHAQDTALPYNCAVMSFLQQCIQFILKKVGVCLRQRITLTLLTKSSALLQHLHHNIRNT